LGEECAFRDGVERHKRNMERIELERFVTAQRRIDRQIDAYRCQVRGVVADVLIASGYHQHSGQWRKKRTMANEIVKATKAEMVEYSGLMQTALAEAAKGKKKGPALDKLRAYIDAHPGVFDSFAFFASTTRSEVINCTTPTEATRLHLEGEASAMERALGIETATPLERLLIDDVIICWLRMQTFEQTYSTAYATGGGVSFAKAQYLESRLSATHRRYLQSVETLARIRRLVVNVQINVGQNQVIANGA